MSDINETKEAVQEAIVSALELVAQAQLRCKPGTELWKELERVWNNLGILEEEVGEGQHDPSFVIHNPCPSNIQP